MATVAAPLPDPKPPPPCSSSSDQHPPCPISSSPDLTPSGHASTPGLASAPDLTPSGYPHPNLLVPSLPGLASASIPAPAAYPRSSDPPPPPDPFPPLPSASRPSSASRSVPNLLSPSSDPPPPPPPPFPTPNPSSAALLQPLPPLLAVSPALLPSSQVLSRCASEAPPLVVVPPYPDPYPPLSSAPPLYAHAAAAGNRPPPPPVPPRDPLQPSSLPPSRGTTPPPRSYAQVSRGLKGSGFVRYHASEVESFARLPRTGANIICGSKEGIPSFSIDSSDLARVEELYSNALVMKFHGGRPSLEVSHKEIQSWGLEQPFTIGPLSSRAFLLRFQDNKDLIRVLSRPSSFLITFPYKIFRWHNLCHIKDDSCYAPVWISLPRLPLQCFIPEFLESVANNIGRFLCLDKATATLARPSAARICIELDLRKSRPQFIWVDLFEGLKQPIIYEKVPKFCSLCIVQGHTAVDCPTGQREAISKQTDPHGSSICGRTPPVRQNATRPSPSVIDHQYASSATIHNPTNHSPPPPPPDVSHLATISSVADDADRAPSSNIDSAINEPSAVMDPQPRPPPPPVAPLECSPTPAVAIQSTVMHVQHSVKQPEPSPNQHKAIAFEQTNAPSSHQSSSTVAVPPPPTRPSSSRPSTAVPQSINRSPIDPHLQAQPSAARSLAAAVPSSSHASAQATLILPSAVAPAAGSAPQPAASSWAPPPLLSQQFNMEANQVFWNAVNYQLALNEQARHRATTGATSSRPTVSRPLENITPSALTVATQSSPVGDDSSYKSSDAADSQPNSPSSPTTGAYNPYASVQKLSYVSEGEELMSDPTSFQGHNTDDMLWQRPRTSKRNKRHPDQPLKVQLRTRKARNLQPAC